MLKRHEGAVIFYERDQKETFSSTFSQSLHPGRAIKRLIKPVLI